MPKNRNAPPMTSWIWNYFDRTDDTAICKDCSKVLSIKSSTWGIRRHLQTKHGIDCPKKTTRIMESRRAAVSNAAISKVENDVEMVEDDDDETNPGESTMSESHENAAEMDNSPGAQNGYVSSPLRGGIKRSSSPALDSIVPEHTITDSIARMIAVDMLPLSFSENRGFRNFMENLVPSYSVPPTAAIERCIDRLHADAKVTLAMRLQQYNHVVLTTDFWTSEDMATYLTISVHAITPDWQCHSHVLNTKEVLQWYSSENLRQHIKSTVEEWDLMGKVLVCVHENSTNINACVKKSKFLGPGVPCLAHMLKAAVMRTLRLVEVTELLKKASNIVRCFNTSSAAAKALQTAQIAHELPCCELILSSKTRWESALHMIQRLLEQRSAITDVLANDQVVSPKNLGKLIIGDDDWTNMKQLEELLEPLEAVATVISASPEPATLSLARPLVHGLLKNFFGAYDSESELQGKLKTRICDDFIERYLEATGEGVALLATFLDPRYKDLAGEPETVINATKIQIQQELDEIGENTATNNSNSNRRAAMDFLLTGRRSTDRTSNQVSEMSMYLAEACIDSEHDPRQWWRENQYKYPRLSALARRYLTIPATSIPTERVDVDVEHGLRTKRSRIGPESVDPLIFMHQNADLV